MAQAVAFQATMPGRIAAECERLASRDIGMIVGDIPPLAFEVAARLGVPSLAISNFTWDWIYEWYEESLAQAPALLEQIRRATGAPRTRSNSRWPAASTYFRQSNGCRSLRDTPPTLARRFGRGSIWISSDLWHCCRSEATVSSGSTPPPSTVSVTGRSC